MKQLLKTIMRYINTFFDRHEERFAFLDLTKNQVIVIDPLGNQLFTVGQIGGFDDEAEAKQHMKDNYPSVEFVPLQHFMGHPKFMRAHRAGGFQRNAFFEAVHKELVKAEQGIADFDNKVNRAKNYDDIQLIMEKMTLLEDKRSALLDLLKLSSYEARADSDNK